MNVPNPHVLVAAINNILIEGGLPFTVHLRVGYEELVVSVLNHDNHQYLTSSYTEEDLLEQI